MVSIVVLFYLLKVLKYYCLTKFLMRGPIKLHNEMTYSIIRAKKQFFDRNPSGRILNRFSSDTGLLDLMIYELALTCVDIFSNEIVTLLTLIYISVYLTPPVIIIFYCYCKIGLTFKKPLNKLR